LTALRQAIDAHAIVAITDARGIITFVNDRFCEISKYSRQELLGQTHRIIKSDHHPKAFFVEMWRTISRGGVWHGEVCNRAKDGSLYWLYTTICPVKDASNAITHFISIRTDITECKTVEAARAASRAFERAARIDLLTGLPNRTVLLDRIQGYIRLGRTDFAVVFLDFDRFKLVNDSLGHDVGDALLKDIANRLRNELGLPDSSGAGGEDNCVARLGGDEFVVLLANVANARQGSALAERLLAALEPPRVIQEYEVQSTASMGLVMGDAQYARAEEMIRDADTAMYEAKRSGKNRCVVFNPAMRERILRRLTLEKDLRRAIPESQLSLAYQPILSLFDGELRSVEALLRWTHPTLGPIGPGEFIPIAEESDLILRLGEWVLEEGCRQLAAWTTELGSLAPRTVSINLSRKQFMLPNLPDLIRRVIERSGIAPARVQLEVTEDFFASDLRAAIDAMRSIKSLGVKLAIDDFGTGASSFASLHQFPVDVLKIDRSMLSGVERSKDTAALIHSLAVLVRNLGITMVAEGIEKPSQVIALQELGCELGQGYYFARPMSAAAIQEAIVDGALMRSSVGGAMSFANRWQRKLEVFEATLANT
jgi:diguanylate cyclase (GGDEF)-like protein/PAS domain S-box-containing protein